MRSGKGEGFRGEGCQKKQEGLEKMRLLEEVGNQHTLWVRETVVNYEREKSFWKS